MSASTARRRKLPPPFREVEIEFPEIEVVEEDDALAAVSGEIETAAILASRTDASQLGRNDATELVRGMTDAVETPRHRLQWIVGSGIAAASIAAAIVIGFAESRHSIDKSNPPTAPLARVSAIKAVVVRSDPSAPAPASITPAIIEAEPPATRVAKVANSKASAAYRAGLRSFARGDNAAALEAFRRALARDPEHAPSWRALGFALERQGSTDEARTALERYLQLAPGADDAAQVRAHLEDS